MDNVTASELQIACKHARSHARARCRCWAPAVAVIAGEPLCADQLAAWRELLPRLGPDAAIRALGLARRAA